MNILSTSKSFLFNSASLIGVNALLNVVFSSFGHCLLSLIHNLYSIILFLNELYIQTFRFISCKTNFSQDVSLINSELRCFNKIPSHLVLILGPEIPSYVDLVKIIVWSFAAGITHLSFYDHKNFIEPQELFENVSKHGKDFIPRIKWNKSFSEELKLLSKKLINGYSWNPTVHVNIYKREDGLENILETVRYLHRRGIGSVSLEDMDRTMKKHLEAPDPDLAIICGPALSYYGFPPWNLRITLMQNITSHHNLNVSSFLQHLSDYSRSEQRYGK